MMMKFLVVVMSSCASAFLAPPVQQTTTTMKVTMAEVTSDSGVSAPFGYFDPLGLMENEWQLERSYKYFKEVEIKHGRVARFSAEIQILCWTSFHFKNFFDFFLRNFFLKLHAPEKN